MKIEMKFPTKVVSKVFEKAISDALIKLGVYPAQVESIEMCPSRSKEYPLIVKVKLKDAS